MLGCETDMLCSWYFKEAALLDRGKYTPSETHTVCGWKGELSFTRLVEGGGKEG